MKTVPTGKLFICPTPIGNLEDISGRVITVLSQVDLIACEDTRHTGRLLRHLSLSVPMVSYHEHNEAVRVPGLVSKLKQGLEMALVSDAGTPAMSDPGYRLVKAAAAEGIEIISLPGPCAFITALVASGLPPEPCAFYGFLPRQGKERRQALARLSAEAKTMILYEAPHRLEATIKDLADELGGARPAAWGRELTKMHEEYRRGTLMELARDAQGKKPRGEYVLIIAGAEKQEEEKQQKEIDGLLEKLLEAGLSPGDASRAASVVMGIPRNLLYRRVLKLDKK